ncbi:hypothetical protein LCGC14_1739300 [marine sediment metagenome]|uniref:Tyr recombinase domain-containing protein n=1 Tax=marine sediment metagenome TaxID=412755 RepID=A0A0F9K6W3_9ZZZZ
MARGAVVKRKSGNYAIVFWVDGKQKWKTLGPNKKEAEKALNEAMSRVHDGCYSEDKEIGFSEFAEKWLFDYKKSRVKPATFRFYSDIFRIHANPYFKDMSLKRLKADKIDAYVAFKTKEGKLANKTIGYHITVLKMLLKQAVIWGYLKTNPAQYIEKPRAQTKEMDYLRPEEIRLFLDNARKEFHPFFLTAVFTGMRRGELIALKWSDINWATGNIHVKRTESRGLIHEPKSKRSIRSIVMAPVLVSTLKKHRLSCPTSDQDFVFPNRDGNLMDGSHMYNREFMPALRRAGLRHIRFHDLRHTYVALLVSQGENIKFIQHQLGHASIQTTLDRYGHLLPEVHNGVGNRLQETIFGSQTTAESNSSLESVKGS